MRNIKRVSLYTVRWAVELTGTGTPLLTLYEDYYVNHIHIHFVVVVIKAIASAAHLEIPFRMRWWWLEATESQVSLECFPFSPSLDLPSARPPKQTVPTRQLATAASWHCEYTLYRGVAPPDPTPPVFTSRSIDCKYGMSVFEGTFWLMSPKNVTWSSLSKMTELPLVWGSKITLDNNAGH